MGGRARNQIVRIGSLTVLLLAVLPNLTYVGHWGAFGGHAEKMETGEDADEHAAHCHLGPSKCADGAGMGHAVPQADQALLLALGALSLSGWTPRVAALSGFPARWEIPPRGILATLAS